MKRKITEANYQTILKVNIIEGWHWVILRHYTVRVFRCMTKRKKAGK